jgi:GNAT superfamily N-acetyltransferase
MRAKEFAVEYREPKSKQAHRGGIDLEAWRDGLHFQITATSHGRDLGHVVFDVQFQGKDTILVAQDLMILPEYRGQGIAAIMYDYAKELGYVVERSPEQTDAGRAFWDKNRGEQGLVWESDARTATANQVLAYINRTHHEPLTPKLELAVKKHPQWQLQQVPLQNLNIPDEEYDDIEQEPESDPYGRVMAVDPEHAGEVSQNLIDKRPIVIDADRYIIDGNHRAWAAMNLLNRDYIQAWVPTESITEVNYPDELTVSDQIQQYFFQRGYDLAGEGRDQMAFESPRGTIVKVLGTGEDEREQVVRRYVRFFEQNQRNPFYPRIYNSGDFEVAGETYFVYEMERVNYVANEEATLDYIEKLMSAVDREQGEAFLEKNPVPAEMSETEIFGLIQATEDMIQVLGGQAPLDLTAVENLGRRNNGHLVIVDPYSL